MLCTRAVLGGLCRDCVLATLGHLSAGMLCSLGLCCAYALCGVLCAVQCCRMQRVVMNAATCAVWDIRKKKNLKFYNQ